MKLSVLILSILGIGLNISGVAGQSSNNNNLIINDLQNLLSQTQQNVRAYLSTILVDNIIKNVDAIFASASSNLTILVNNSHNCARLVPTTTSTSNCLLYLISFKNNSMFNLYISHFNNNYNQNK